MNQSLATSLSELHEVISRHWGFNQLRPLQQKAMEAVLAGRDSLVVMPTGGGKSLCYQAPAAWRGDTTVVISPLISLMKDQVDSLRACGVAAVHLDSSMSASERAKCEQLISRREARLVFVSPERLAGTDIFRLFQSIDVKTFAIDEAHCISHWGHDFRPEYRQLRRLRDLFPGCSIHAYTATATEQVRADIIDQLGLTDPEILVGNFDRANLTYRIHPRRDTLKQVLEIIGRHKGEGGIIYCLRRSDVDEMTKKLQAHGVKATAYHAGMTADQRIKSQDAFVEEKSDVVVATVAFGMGIDRSNVRYVLHIALPKSIEHYQQETGRAGRDGLEAECVLLYSGADFFTWKSIVEKSSGEPGYDPQVTKNALKHLDDMGRYARGAVCRHRALVQYFGQVHESENCAACDICFGETIPVPNAQVVAQKILSCVARVKLKFGAGHIISVLRGENSEAIKRWGHDSLSTYGLLKEHGKDDIREWIYQLIGQGVLLQEELETSHGNSVPIIKLNAESWEVMRDQRSVRLLAPVKAKKGERAKKSKTDTKSWEGVDRDLFEELRVLRRQLADERGVPPYVIFADATLRELASKRPSSLVSMRSIYGIGDAKLADYGDLFLKHLLDFCQRSGVHTDA